MAEAPSPPIEPVPCPLCGCEMKIYEDRADSVGEHLAGFYLSHPLWVPYPTATNCALHPAMSQLPKAPTREECAASWKDLAKRIESDGPDGLLVVTMIHLLGVIASEYRPLRKPLLIDQSGSMHPLTDPEQIIIASNALTAAGFDFSFTPAEVERLSMDRQTVTIDDAIKAIDAHRSPNGTSVTEAMASVFSIMDRMRGSTSSSARIVFTDGDSPL